MHCGQVFGPWIVFRWRKSGAKKFSISMKRKLEHESLFNRLTSLGGLNKILFYQRVCLCKHTIALCREAKAIEFNFSLAVRTPSNVRLAGSQFFPFHPWKEKSFAKSWDWTLSQQPLKTIDHGSLSSSLKLATIVKLQHWSFNWSFGA